MLIETIQTQSKKIRFVTLRWGNFERCFAVLSLTLYSGAFVLTHFASSESGMDATEGSPLVRAIFLSLYVLTILFSLLRLPKFVKILNATLVSSVLLLLCIAWLSIGWSANPEITFRRNIALMGTSLFGFYFAARFNQYQQLQLLAWTFGLLAVSSIVYAVFLPEYGIDPVVEYAWRGVFLQKNGLGRMMAIGLIVCLLLSSKYRSQLPVGYWLLIAVFSTLIVLSKSTGAMVTLFSLFPIWLFYSSAQFKPVYGMLIRFFVVVIVLLAIFILIEQIDSILLVLGKDITLTGRTELWTSMIEVIRVQPWFGYGYGAFWLGWSGPSKTVWEAMPPGFRPLHGHSGYLDMLAELGIVGLATFLFGWLFAFRSAHQIAIKQHDPLRLWKPFFLILLIVYSVIETVLLTRNDLLWVLYISTVLLQQR